MNRIEHLLACVAEECAEVAQRALKAQRFGLLEIQPEHALNNWQRLIEEFTDLLAVIEMLETSSGSPYCILCERVEAKKRKVERFMAYAEEQGALILRPKPPQGRSR
jgi:NTP pyrophosphatase (non-canonical NTP hydrolase)